MANCLYLRLWAMSSSILSYNGSAMVAMKGEKCVAIATDRCHGAQGRMVTTDSQKVFCMGPHLYLGLPGLATDVQTVHEVLQFRCNMYELREERRVRPAVLARLVSNLLYEKRFAPYFVEPVVAGLDGGEPYVCSMDLIGCTMVADDFVVGGTCNSQLYGMCEALWAPRLSTDALFETVSQALLNAFDRDAMSGWGAAVHLVQPHQVTTRLLKTRMD